VGARESYLEAGFDDYLSKPVEIGALERALKKYLPESRIEEAPKKAEGPKISDVRPEKPLEPPREPDYEDEEIMEFLPEDEMESEGAAREFSEIRRDLEAMEIHVKDGIAYCGGEEEFYQEILLDYANTYEEKRKALGDDLAAKDLENYTIKVHALKGVAKTVGDMKIFEQALALEMAGKGGQEETIQRDHPKLMKAYEERANRILEIVKGE
ncbi:MAG: hypothetical protein J6Z22_01685, partial [Lachnospiraceae bacterium]|nr:hypothetical protein [Lachnospiraceae bacterium]